MWSSSSRARGVLLVLMLAGAPVLANPSAAEPTAAEPTPQQVEAAKDEFVSGLELRDKGDLEGALAHFRAAYGLVPTPITALEVGKTEVRLGRLAAARATFAEAAVLPMKQGESGKAVQAREEAAKLAEQTRAKLARLRVAFDPQPPSPPEVAVDGRPQAGPGPYELDPGHHSVAVRGGGKVGREEVVLREAEERTLTVALRDDPAAHREAPAVARRIRLGPLFWAGVGTAAVGIVACTATGAAAFAVTGTVKGECPQKTCPASAAGDVDTAKALGWTSTVAFIVAGAGGVLALVGLLTAPRVEVGRMTGRVLVGPGTIGLWCVF